MSTFTKYANRSMSVVADGLVAVAASAVTYLVFGIIKGAIPLGDALQAGFSGVIGAAVYIRARQNLLDNTPAFKE